MKLSDDIWEKTKKRVSSETTLMTELALSYNIGISEHFNLLPDRHFFQRACREAMYRM